MLTKAVKDWQKACGKHCLTVLKPRSFYPIRWQTAKIIFENEISENRTNRLLKGSYVLHAFDFAAGPAAHERPKPGSIFHRVYRKNCVICSL